MALELIIEERGAPPRTQLVASDTAFIGRREDCEVVLPYSFVSARHARLSVRGGEVVVEDLGSTNGVLVNGEALSPLVPRALGPGDVVEIEKIAIRARATGQATLAPEPTFHEIRVPPSAVATAVPPLPTGVTRTAPVPSASATAPRALAPAAPPAPTPVPGPGPRPVPATGLSLSPPVLGERADAASATTPRRAPGRSQPSAGLQGLAERFSASNPLAPGRLLGGGRFLVLSLLFRGIGILAVLGGLTLLLLVLLA